MVALNQIPAIDSLNQPAGVWFGLAGGDVTLRVSHGTAVGAR